jgi:TfoX/Sxy family transcriptional regulator of competence genes
MSQKRTTLTEFTAEMVEALTPVGEVHSRPMFGCYGIFENGTMFVLIDRYGTLFFRADSTTKSRYEAAGSIQHNPMPYYEVPREVADDYSTFIDWAKEASEVAHAAKKRR